jgi:hypothetical protein
VKWIGFAAYVCVTAFLYLIFAYLADLSFRQSLVLAIVLAALLAYLERGIGNAMPKACWKFRPYYVWVSPKWSDLLTDFKLIGRPEEWPEIEKAVRQEPLTEYRVLRSGIRFTIVRESSDLQESLIYWDNDRRFVSEVGFGQEISPIKTTHGDVLLIVRFQGDGYALGIYVPIPWWEEVKTSCPKPLEEFIDSGRGRIELILTTVSDREFDVYREPVWNRRHSIDKGRGWWEQIEATRAEQRNKFGWKKVEHPEIPELGHVDWPESLEHKYFNLEHHEI